MKTKRQIHKLFNSYQREKKRCAKLYPDWEDNALNALHNRFIWGITEDSDIDHADFSTSNVVCIYYNRQDKCYYLSVDMTKYSDIDEMCVDLKFAVEALHQYVFRHSNEYDVPYNKYIQNMFLDTDFYRCEDIVEAYVKLRILTAGLISYWDYNDICKKYEPKEES